MAQGPVVIRKYENRRLYDTAASRYVNLEDVAEMVRQGANVQVVDVKTGEDITRVILTQIIVEDAKGRESGLPLDFLRQLVIASGRASQEGFARYVKAVFDTYQTAYEAFHSRLRSAAPLAAAPLDFVQAIFNPQQPSAPPEAPRSDTEMHELRRRIEDLELKLAAANHARRRRRSTH